MAPGTGLRLRELPGLDARDVSPDGREVRRVTLDRATTNGGRKGEVLPPARLITKLEPFLSWKRTNGQTLDLDAPRFVPGQGATVIHIHPGLMRRWLTA